MTIQPSKLAMKLAEVVNFEICGLMEDRANNLASSFDTALAPIREALRISAERAHAYTLSCHESFSACSNHNCVRAREALALLDTGGES